MSGDFRPARGRGERGITRAARSIAKEGRGHPSARALRPVLDGRGGTARLFRVRDCYRMGETKGSGSSATRERGESKPGRPVGHARQALT
jgi:hypothetical protein